MCGTSKTSVTETWKKETLGIDLKLEDGSKINLLQHRLYALRVSVCVLKSVCLHRDVASMLKDVSVWKEMNCPPE